MKAGIHRNRKLFTFQNLISALIINDNEENFSTISIDRVNLTKTITRRTVDSLIIWENSKQTFFYIPNFIKKTGKRLKANIQFVIKMFFN